MKLTYALQQRLLKTPLRFLFVLLGWGYAGIVRIRDILYRRGILRARRLPRPVISVGNIAVGGTGKTPAVLAIARLLQAEGLRVAVLLRGYKRQSREKVTIVSDGKQVCADQRESGDEAYLLATALRDVPIIVGRCRYTAGRLALERFKVDVLLLDDGFQHRQLARDMDVVTLPTTHPFGSPAGTLLPVGTLREPPDALRRAALILLTHADTPDTTRRAKEAVTRFAPAARILTSTHQPTRLYPLIPQGGEQATGVAALKGKRVLAVCGIGNPEPFVATLKRCAVASVELLTFPDHHRYTAADAQRICAAFQNGSADIVVTTQKDEQKLRVCMAGAEIPIAVLAVALVITEGDATFREAVFGSLHESNRDPLVSLRGNSGIR